MIEIKLDSETFGAKSYKTNATAATMSQGILDCYSGKQAGITFQDANGNTICLPARVFHTSLVEIKVI